MSSDESVDTKFFSVELWVWFVITYVVTIARIISRRLLLGSFKKYKIDDYLMIGAMVTYTIVIVGVKLLENIPTNSLDPNDPDDVVTPENLPDRILGSKLAVVVEQMQVTTIWIVKACFLIMYSRLTTSLGQNRIVNIVAIYVAGGFVIMEILFFGVWCRPFWHYWEVPSDDEQCLRFTNHLITNAVLNISSDIMIIALPMPVFLQSRLPLKKKMILCTIFGLAIFTIISAIVNKYYDFTGGVAIDWIYWYIRETSTAIIVANLPLTWALAQRIFNLRSFDDNSTSPAQIPSIAPQLRSAGDKSCSSKGTMERTAVESWGEEDIGASESREHIVQAHAISLEMHQPNEVITTEMMAGNPEHRDLQELNSSKSFK